MLFYMDSTEHYINQLCVYNSLCRVFSFLTKYANLSFTVYFRIWCWLYWIQMKTHNTTGRFNNLWNKSTTTATTVTSKSSHYLPILSRRKLSIDNFKFKCKDNSPQISNCTHGQDEMIQTRHSDKFITKPGT